MLFRQKHYARLKSIRKDIGNNRILDFASGNGWIAEWLNRMGFDVVAFDNARYHVMNMRLRCSLDSRVNPDLMSPLLCDGAHLAFKNESFANVICFDSLHHMRDYMAVLAEMNRILIHGGRAIFVEPGARHSTSKETIEFLEKNKALGTK